MPSRSIDSISEEEFESMVQLLAGDDGSPLPPPPPPPPPRLASAPARAQCMLSGGRLLGSCLPSLSGTVLSSAYPTSDTTLSPHLPPPPPPPPPPFPPGGVLAKRPKSAARSRSASDGVQLRKLLWEKAATNQHSRTVESLSAAADCPVWWLHAVPHGVQADEASLLILFAVVQVIYVCMYVCMHVCKYMF